MSTHTIRRRAIAATAGIAITATSFAVGAGSAFAAPRPAETSVDTTYLSDTLGLPAQTVVETVTYDRFQWLLQQPGQYAFLIGSAYDPGFPAKAVQADLAAKEAGASKIYWYDPNFTGVTGIKNLDTRNPSGIKLAASSQTIFGNTWRNVLGRYLGNGIKSVPNASGTTATITYDDSIVNDVDAPVFDYRSTESAAVSSTDDVFFVYDKDRTVDGVADKIVSWVNLSTAADAPGEIAATFTAAGGGAVIDQLSQFNWWKDSANRKHDVTYPDDNRYGGDIIDDSDAADGWRVQQVTYPELQHLLAIKDSASKNFVLLFGGTWCHNTRAVLKNVNEEAQENDVKTVYNFDLVLDGGTVNGSNGGANPIHVRDNAASGSTFNFRPSYVYGDLVRTNLRNVVTEFDPNAGNRVAYYPGGDLTAFPDVVRKLQVPFLVNYQRGTATSPSTAAVKRQWIQQNTDESTGLPTFKEYMTEAWFTNPSPQIGLNFAIPADESTLSGSQKSQFTQARANVDFAAEALDKLEYFFGGLPGAVVSTQTLTAPDVAYGAVPTVSLAIENKYGRIPAGTVTLTIAGKDYQETIAQNGAEFELPKLAAGSYPYTVAYPGDAQVVAFSKSGTLVVTKAKVSATAGAVATKPTTASAGKYKVSITAPSGQTAPTGKVTVTLKSGTATKTVTGTLSKGAVTVTLPKLAAGTWKSTVAYAGDSNYSSSSAAGASVAVAKVAVGKTTGAVATKSTTASAGKYKVTLAAKSGLTAPTGKVTVTFKKGTSVKKVTGTLSKGAVTVTLPKLASGTWKSTVAYAGDSNYSSSSAAGASVAVAKVAVGSTKGAVVTKPTTKASGKYKVTLAAKSGLTAPTGKVTVTFKKGTSAKKVTGTLSKGAVTVVVPKLAKGTWKSAVAYAGDSNYSSSSAAGASVSMTK